MEWIDLKERIPEKEGKILVLIGETVLCINAKMKLLGTCYLNLEKIYCEIEKTYEFEEGKPKCFVLGTPLKTIVKYNATFFKPSHYSEITHWCEVPELPIKRIKLGEDGEILSEVNGEIGWVREDKKDVIN